MPNMIITCTFIAIIQIYLGNCTTCEFCIMKQVDKLHSFACIVFDILSTQRSVRTLNLLLFYLFSLCMYFFFGSTETLASTRCLHRPVQSFKPAAGVKPCNKGECGPCALCSKSSTRYAHLVTIKSKELAELIQSKNSQLRNTDCICNACRIKYSNKLKDSTYTPEKSRKKERNEACFLSHVLLCSNPSEVDSCIPVEKFNELYGTEFDNLPDVVPLCMMHRKQISNFISFQECSVCGHVMRPSGLKKIYRVSELVDLQQVLIINENYSLSDEDLLCRQCYSFCTRGTNKNLTITDIEAQLESEPTDEEAEEINSVLNELCIATFKEICSWCKKNCVFLLADAYDQYLRELGKKYSVDSDEYDEFSRSSKWLLSRILGKFGSVLSVHKSTSKKKGIMLYLSSATFDQLVDSLHDAQSKVRYLSSLKSNEGKFPRVSREEETEHIDIETKHLQVDSAFRQLMVEGNARLRQQVKDNNSNYTDNPLTIDDFDLDAAVLSFDPLIWNMVFLLTSSVSELNTYMKSSISVANEKIFSSEESNKVKQIRRAVVVFLLQYIMSESCLYPIQIINAHVIKRFSHSSRLIQVMNRLGFCCSESTLERFLQLVEDERQSSGPLINLSPNAVTYVSIDNIDSLAPYAAVRPDQPRSWHGTSIMAQQPKPQSEFLHDTMEKLGPSLPSTSQSIHRTGRPSARKRLKLIEPVMIPSKEYFKPTLFKTYVSSQVTWDTFTLSQQEKEALSNCKSDMLLYIFERIACLNDKDSSLPVIPSFKSKLYFDDAEKSTEKSLFSYLNVIDLPADSPHTVKSCIQLLYDTFKITVNMNHLVVCGDGATFKILLDIKREYGDALQWMIPYIGDWHLLKNYQEVLMKIFWDGGLKTLAKGIHKNVTLTSVGNCSNFKRTHRFLVQVHEAILMLQFNSFLNHRENDEQISNTSFLNEIVSIVKSFKLDECLEEVSSFKSKQISFLSSLQFTQLREEFEIYCHDMCEKLETFRFWHRFVHEDCMAYINLYVAIRSRNWQLRNAAIKSMVPLFHSCDRQNYAKMIPIHLSMIQALPSHVKQHFENGAFASSITGNNYSSVAFDEAHEMLINKHCKAVISRGLPKNMEKVAGTIQYQAKVIHNFEDQLGLTNDASANRDLSPSVIQAEFSNVKVYYAKLLETKMFLPDQEPQLHHVFTQVNATKEQQASLLSYHEIGSEAYEVFCKYQILKDTSNIKPVVRQHRLKTFAKKKVSKRKITSLEKEKKMITMCYKRTIAFSEERGQPVSALCQFIEKPRAICDTNNMPQKGAKWVIYDIFDKRYGSKLKIITSMPCVSLVGACFIAEGMNMIYTSPLRHYRTFSDYVSFLVARWVIPFFKKGCKEVRVLFDQVDSQGLSPKSVERSRRDATEEETDVYTDISDETILPPNWQKFLKVRTQKHLLIRYLSRKMIQAVRGYLQEGQVFITSGGFHVGLEAEPGWSGVEVSKDGERHHSLIHNHEESDTQIFLHVFDSSCSNIVIYSIDRDVGIVALPLNFGSKTICLQYRAKAGDERFLNINLLQQAIRTDSDFAPVMNKNIDILKCIQSLYISSGCDFVSYFCHLGKSTFFNTFAQYALFISGETLQDVTLSLTCTDVQNDSEQGLLSFYRLILCVYFKVNRACLHDFDTPVQLYNSITCNNLLERHEKSLDIVRRASWKGTYEDQLLPSHSALRFHWLRACWVSSVWGRCTVPVFNYPDIRRYGFSVSGEGNSTTVDFIWDTQENIDRIRNTVSYLTRGCSCKKNKCVNRQCKCKKQDRYCGPGCSCRNCGNLEEPESSSSGIESDSDESELSDSDDADEEVDGGQGEGSNDFDFDALEISDEDEDILHI